MDLSAALDTAPANEGSVMEVRDANGAPILKPDGKPVTITLLGADSDVAVRHTNQVTNRRLSAGTRVKLTAESLNADSIAMLAKCTVGWDGVGIGEDDTPFSQDAAVRLYTSFPAIREQVDLFIGDRANFLRPSPKT